ncbi:MAG: 23S rRNA (adenine(2503)-C(2))-methyltransferase RlmN [Spirochaetes bacterium]|nr:23S rRNA (adenine(2503)-C(2))-methyltransferase RlmN [Spirochaetota bacterium]
MKLSILELQNNHPLIDKKFRHQQIRDFVFKKYNLDFTGISTLPKKMRERLEQEFVICPLKEISRITAADQTTKFLFQLGDQVQIESVVLFTKNQQTTFCISSQCGCRMGCQFCQTGKMGLVRNLTCSEIIAQVLFLANFSINNQLIQPDEHFNIVFMGMGEPLDNLLAVKEALHYLTHPDFFHIASSRITISTCGMLDQIEPLLKDFPKIKLAVSLNSAIDEKREQIMPINKKFPIKKIAADLTKIYGKYGNRITLEYVLINDFNDGPEDWLALKEFQHKAFHINIIPFNDTNNLESKKLRPSESRIKRFIKELEDIGFRVSRRYRRGSEIQADCGQLYWKNKTS